MEITKTPTGLVVRIPDDVAEKLALKAGDEVVVLPRLTGETARKPVDSAPFDEMIERVRKMGPLIPAGYKFKRSDAYDEE